MADVFTGGDGCGCDPLVMRQEGTRFFCENCGEEYWPSPETMIELLPMQTLCLVERFMFPLRLILWALTIFLVFQTKIAWGEWKYEHGKKAMVDAVTDKAFGWVTIHTDAGDFELRMEPVTRYEGRGKGLRAHVRERLW